MLDQFPRHHGEIGPGGGGETTAVESVNPQNSEGILRPLIARSYDLACSPASGQARTWSQTGDVGVALNGGVVRVPEQRGDDLLAGSHDGVAAAGGVAGRRALRRRVDRD